MEVYLSETANKYLSKIEKDIYKSIRDKLKEVEEHGIFSNRFDVKKLEGKDEKPQPYRLRVGDYRIIFSLDGNKMLVTRIIHRSEGYGFLK